MEHIPSNLCQLNGLSCMGCCGHSFKSKLDVAKDIEKNTKEFGRHDCKVKFMNRSQGLRSSGICHNLIYDVKEDTVHCPLHPKRNRGKELRHNHLTCDILHVCKTAFLFELWDENTKKKFISFLGKKKRKGMCWHDYSMKMVKDELLDEFEGLNW